MIINNIIRQIEKVPATFLIWFLLCIRFVNFELIGNEEQYFALARHYMDPEWIKGAFPLQEFTGTRVIFETIAGVILQYITFEQFAFWGRAVIFLLMAIPLGKIFTLLKIPKYLILFILSIYIFRSQALFANEWIFMGIEAKSLAYVFIFWAVYMLLKNKLYQALIYVSLATYFHALVGGWFLLYILFYLLLEKHPILLIVKGGLFYFILTLPFIIFLFPTYVNDAETVIGGINTNWIYVYYRNPHHLAPFKSIDFFIQNFLAGVIISIFLLYLCIFVFSKVNNSIFRQLNNLNISLFAFQILFILISIFDSNGVLLKYYPFRSSALSFLFILIEIFIYLRLRQNNAFHIRLSSLAKLKNIAITITVILISYYITSSAIAFNTYFTETKTSGSRIIAKYLKENTHKDDVILNFINNDDFLPLMRESERSLFIINKFIPTTPNLLHEWYIRNELQKEIYLDPTTIKRACKQYEINYVVSDMIIHLQEYLEVFSYKDYYVYTIDCNRILTEDQK